MKEKKERQTETREHEQNTAGREARVIFYLIKNTHTALRGDLPPGARDGESLFEKKNNTRAREIEEERKKPQACEKQINRTARMK